MHPTRHYYYFVFTIIQGIYNYIPEKNRVSRVYRVAAVVCLQICATHNAICATHNAICATHNVISHGNYAPYRTKNLINKSHLVTIAFKNWHFVFPEGFTLVLKSFADAPLIFVVIKTKHLVRVINGVV